MVCTVDQTLSSLWRSFEVLRLGPLKEGSFTSKLHSEKTAAILGIALGITFTICFITGLLSHGIQRPPSWFLWPSVR